MRRMARRTRRMLSFRSMSMCQCVSLDLCRPAGILEIRSVPCERAEVSRRRSYNQSPERVSLAEDFNLSMHVCLRILITRHKSREVGTLMKSDQDAWQ